MMRKPFTLRAAQPADAPGIAHVHQSVWHDETLDPLRVARLIADGQRYTAVAVHDGEVIGFADGFITTSASGVRRWELDLIAVLPQCHRQGVASALVSAMNAPARDHRAAVVRALAHQANVAIHRTLQKAGYTCHEPGLSLYVASAERGAQADAPAASHLIPVETLSYAGVWLEGEITPRSLRLARHCAARAGCSVAGVLIAEPAGHTQDAAHDAGYALVGQYRWWSLPLDA